MVAGCGQRNRHVGRRLCAQGDVIGRTGRILTVLLFRHVQPGDGVAAGCLVGQYDGGGGVPLGDVNLRDLSVVEPAAAGDVVDSRRAVDGVLVVVSPDGHVLRRTPGVRGEGQLLGTGNLDVASRWAPGLRYAHGDVGAGLVAQPDGVGGAAAALRQGQVLLIAVRAGIRVDEDGGVVVPGGYRDGAYAQGRVFGGAADGDGRLGRLGYPVIGDVQLHVLLRRVVAGGEGQARQGPPHASGVGAALCAGSQPGRPYPRPPSIGKSGSASAGRTSCRYWASRGYADVYRSSPQASLPTRPGPGTAACGCGCWGPCRPGSCLARPRW